MENQHISIGEALQQAYRYFLGGDGDASERILEEVVRLGGQHAELVYEIGNAALQVSGDPDAVQRWIAASVACREHFSYSFSLGLLLLRRQAYAEALAAVEEALRRHDVPGWLSTKAQLQWRLGDYRDGNATYDIYRSAILDPQSQFPIPRWKGEDIAGKTILVNHEQGLGDIVQHLRFAELLAHGGATVVVAVPPPLVRLSRGVKGVSTVLDANTPPGLRIDAHVPVMALPHALGLNLDGVSPSSPYITLPETVTTQWRDRVSRHGFRIGITWSGSPSNSSHAERSATLAAYGALARLPGVRMFGLQKGPGVEQLTNSPFSIENLEVGTQDFADTAALMKCLDMVVSVDTSVAHVAGALAVPVITLLAPMADFRWMENRSDTPWYPSMALFRRGNGEGWDACIQRLAVRISNFLADNLPAEAMIEGLRRTA